MSLGTSKMTGNVLRMVLTLLLLASIRQGIQGVELFHYERMEAVVGQNVSIPCTLKSSTDIKIVSIEWRKENTKLGLYSQFHGINLVWQNITVQIEKNSADVLGSHLKLSDVKKSDEGIYVCDTATFPDGSKKVKTQLIIKDDIKITCDVNGTVEVQNGENVTIRCTSFPNAQYRWTKNDELLSETESLELWWVTDADAGVYTLTVNTGSKRVHKEFVVTVLMTTTNLKTVSSWVMTVSAEISLTTSATPELSTPNKGIATTGINILKTTNVTITPIESYNLFFFFYKFYTCNCYAATTQSYTQEKIQTLFAKVVTRDDDDIKITCDVNGTVEVHNGENVTIRCTSFPNAQYRWTKNDELLSETESLELWWVTDADAGVYTLTVNTGNKCVHKEFVVTVLMTTTSLKTDTVPLLVFRYGVVLMLVYSALAVFLYARQIKKNRLMVMRLSDRALSAQSHLTPSYSLGDVSSTHDWVPPYFDFDEES